MKSTFKIKELVSCYVREVIQDSGNFEQICQKLEHEGWRKERDDKRTIYSKGSKLKFTFNYGKNSDLQMRVILKKLKDDKLQIEVGNHGFPIEPLLSKSRYQEFIHHLTLTN